MRKFLKPSLNWLLVFVPIAAWSEFFGHDHTITFITACLAIVPIAGWMGEATEQLAARTGEGIGGLLNATFGNAAELIIALVALSAGQHEIVKASLTGSIIGNLLLVLGASCFAGGLKHKVMKYSGTAVRAYSSMLFLAAAAFVIPAVFHHLGGVEVQTRERDLSLEISIVLIVTYALSLLFSMKTHAHLFIGEAAEAAAVTDANADGDGTHQAWPLQKSIGLLVAATVLIAIIAEWLVGSVTHAAESLGMSSVFVGIIIVAIVGNAAEHSTAIMVARKNRMDLSMAVAIGSSIQIALFVAPVLVFASYFVGPGPLDLVFSPMEVIAVVLAVLVVEQVTSDGETHWLEGVQLLSVYALLALVFYLVPDIGPAH